MQINNRYELRNLRNVCLYLLEVICSRRHTVFHVSPGMVDLTSTSTLNVAWFCHSLAWLLLPLLCWWHPNIHLIPPIWLSEGCTLHSLPGRYLEVYVKAPPKAWDLDNTELVFLQWNGCRCREQPIITVHIQFKFLVLVYRAVRGTTP